MDYQHMQQKRKDKRKYLRLKIITNRDFNFITAIRPDSTVTDLANRALNVYLELSQQNRSKKQLTVTAVKQGMYFMPKSQIVSNLLAQDEQVEIIIVKAKPKFPQQQIPSQHDFEVLTKQIRNFDQLVNRRSNTINMRAIQVQKNIKNIHILNQNSSQSSSSNSSSVQNSQSQSSQLQHSKRYRKKQKKLLKKQMRQTIISKQCNQKRQILPQKKQNWSTIPKNQQKTLIQVKNGNNDNKITQGKLSVKQLSFNIQNVNQDNIVQKILQKSLEKSERQSSEKVHSNSYIKRDFSQILKPQNSQQKIEELKKKTKVDLINKNLTDQVPRKSSIENRSQKTPKINPVQSPKVVFHFESKHESPKIIYIPESKTMSEMKQNIQKQKQKLKIMSPMMLPRNSPKINFMLDPSQKYQQSKALLNSLARKGKQHSAERKVSYDLEEDDKNEGKKDRQPKLPLQPQLKQSLHPSSSVDERRNSMHPQIIEQESSQQQNYVSTKKIADPQSSQRVKSKPKQKQNDDDTIRKKTNVSSKFHQIQNMIKKFKLEESQQQDI